MQTQTRREIYRPSPFGKHADRAKYRLSILFIEYYSLRHWWYVQSPQQRVHACERFTPANAQKNIDGLDPDVVVHAEWFIEKLAMRIVKVALLLCAEEATAVDKGTRWSPLYSTPSAFSKTFGPRRGCCMRLFMATLGIETLLNIMSYSTAQ